MEKTAERESGFNGICSREFEGASMRILDEGERIAELSFSSEAPVERFGVFEVLSHKRDAVMLERLNTSGCLLFNHKRDEVIGKIIHAEIKNKRGIAKVQFDDDEKSMMYYRKVMNGTLRSTSVSYIVHKQTRAAAGKGNGLKVTYTAELWEPIEISIVSVPADVSVGVGRSMKSADEEHTDRYVLNTARCQVKINQNLINAGRNNK